MKKYNKFIFLKYTSDFYKSFMSLENKIPIIERFPHVVNFINDKYLIFLMKMNFSNIII